jgi:hypothetical protein
MELYLIKIVNLRDVFKKIVEKKPNGILAYKACKNFKNLQEVLELAVYPYLEQKKKELVSTEKYSKIEEDIELKKLFDAELSEIDVQYVKENAFDKYDVSIIKLNENDIQNELFIDIDVNDMFKLIEIIN